MKTPQLEHKVFSAEVKKFDDQQLIVEHFISTERRDRGGDSMRADGMKIRGKVVVLLAHGFSGLGQEPIAKPLKIWPETFKGSLGICAMTQFYDGSHLNPPDNTGRRLYEKAKLGFMPNWSIGWIPIKWEDINGPHGEYYRDVLEWELLEYSPVGVPMNPDCQNVDKCGVCQKESWFKVCPTGRPVAVKEFEHYRKLDGKPLLFKNSKTPADGKSVWDEGDTDQDGRLKFEIRTYGDLCQYAEIFKDGVSLGIGLVDMEGKPYPNEHACRIKSPTGYKRIRRNNDKFGKGIHAIWGIKDDNSVELQAIRFSKSKFTAKEARQWCKDHDYKCKPFEAATEKCEQCGGDMVVVFESDVPISADDEEGKTMELEFNYVCPACEEKKKKPNQCKCEKCGHVVKWSKNCDGMKCLKCGGSMKTVEAEKGASFQTKRWNESLSKLFDLDIGERPPAVWEYDLYKKFLKCEIKNIFLNNYRIPSPLLGTYLAGVKQLSEKFVLLDTRSFTSDGDESPPKREVIRLNSTKSDDFLVQGIQFFKNNDIPFVLKFSPNWYGIDMGVITNKEQADFNKNFLEEIHQWVRENNFLKGEKFALSGDFLEKTEDVWDDLILDDELKKIVRSAVSQLNTKKGEMKSRGLLFVGRPGTGKTKVGRTIMNDTNSTFIWVSSKDFQYGSSVGMISLAFSLAKDLSPAVIFMEDIDTWIGNYLVDLLKTEMDGLSQNKGIMTILTSNNPENLPDALLDRPGRFHHVLDFKLPNSKQRLSMLNSWIGEKIDEKILSEIVRETAGFSGAHMRELVDFAKILAEENSIGIGEAIKESLDRLMKQRDLISQIRANQKFYSLPMIELMIKLKEFKAIRSDQADVVKFVMVDADAVREKNNVDFTMGGNHYAWDFIPEDEIWIDQSMDEIDTIATKLHEFVERLVMKYLDWDYNDAHDIASKPERLLRHIMWAETDDNWGDDQDDGDGEEDNWDEEFDSYLKRFLSGSEKIRERINKIREVAGLKPIVFKPKEVGKDEVASFIDFIKTMKEKFNSIETKLDALMTKFKETPVKSTDDLPPVVDLKSSKDNSLPESLEPQKIVAINGGDEEKRRLSEISKQLSKEFNSMMAQYEESTRKLIRSEINKAKGRIE